MISKNVYQKIFLAVVFAMGDVLWLKIWHQYGYSDFPLIFPYLSSWWRDAFIVLFPVALAVWVGAYLAERILDRSPWQITGSSRSVITAFLLGTMASAVFAIVENDKQILTGFGNEFVYLTSICGALYPEGTFFLDLLKSLLTDIKAFRMHILLQDWFYLALFNFAITVLWMLISEGLFRPRLLSSPRMTNDFATD